MTAPPTPSSPSGFGGHLLADPPRKNGPNNTLLIVLVAVLGAAVLALLVIFVIVPVLSSDDDSHGEAPTPAATSTPNPANSNAAAGGPTNVTANGGVSLGVGNVAGTATEGTVVVDVFLDYMCPVCLTFEEVNGPTLDALREKGDVTFVMHPVSILDRASEGTAYSTRAASAAFYVAEHAPKSFADFSAALLEGQPAQGTPGFDNAEIADFARSAGAPDDVIADIAAGTAAATYGEWITGQTRTVATDPSIASADGFGTPTILINGERFEQNWNNPAALEAAIEAAAQ